MQETHAKKFIMDTLRAAWETAGIPIMEFNPNSRLATCGSMSFLHQDTSEGVKAKRKAHSRVRRERIEQEIHQSAEQDSLNDEMKKMLEDISSLGEPKKKPPCFWNRMGNCASPQCKFNHESNCVDVSLYERFYTLKHSTSQDDRDMWTATTGMVKKALHFWEAGCHSKDDLKQKIEKVNKNRTFGNMMKLRFISYMEGEDHKGASGIGTVPALFSPTNS
eukprot:4334987-Amphidinium_carterae.1